MEVKKINEKLKFVFRVVPAILCISLIYCNLPNFTKRVFAGNGDTKIDLNNDGNEETVKFNNGALNIFSIDGKVIFQKNEDKNVYRTIAFIKDKKNKDTKILIQNKTRDTSGTLSYSIYKMDGSEMKEIIHKEEIYKGVVTVKDNGEVLEETPMYVENDSNAVPSFTVKNHFSLEDNKLILLKTEKLSYTLGDSTLNSSEYINNPSHDEIEKIIENVAYEKGIPAAIFKAIAHQESTWRQFSNGKPLIGYDGIGIGIMQVSDYVKVNLTPTDIAYINRLKYDIEFNIREGAEILLTKWALQDSSPTWKIPKVGNGSPNYLENWYYAIWAYNGFSERNNPASNHAKAYQTVVIGHANNIFKVAMTDLYAYNPSLFTAGVLPRTDIAEISGKHAGDFKIKDKDYKYIVTNDYLAIRDGNMKVIGNYNKNDVVTIIGNPIIKDSYVRYQVEGNNKSGYVAGNWIKPVGDTNGDGQVDIYDFVQQSKSINGQGTVINDTNRISIENSDVNMDGVVNIMDIALAAKNYNFYLYRNNIKN
ncbi:dockerin type I repeat-containing protein [Clostridium estertheticum]|uniref:dockerin type I repeat-containing protein n=1 Tax=Clostridium estertheticum TaxID=238834 RepID=UPI0013EE848F|nr:dockerin type I repeat-containing protein [Clostridium estertheticum]MBZ9609302.1 dockerin type I repeat-containing protein [Clostridium estertheticum]